MIFNCLILVDVLLVSSANDEKEVALCLKDLNAPKLYPTVISSWVTDAFERKDLERDMLAKLLISLTKPQDSIFSPQQLIEGYEFLSLCNISLPLYLYYFWRWDGRLLGSVWLVGK